MSTGLVILVAAFVVATLGFFASNLAKDDDRGLFGLSKLGTAMLAVSVVGLIGGVLKERADSKEGELAKEQSRRLQEQLEENSEDLRRIGAKLSGLASRPGITPQLSGDLTLLADRVGAVASSAREGDFRS